MYIMRIRGNRGRQGNGKENETYCTMGFPKPGGPFGNPHSKCCSIGVLSGFWVQDLESLISTLVQSRDPRITWSTKWE